MITENGIIFLGTGSSSSTPKLSHIFKNSKIVSSKGKSNSIDSELKKEDFEYIERFVEELVANDLDCIDGLNDLYLRKKYHEYSDLKCYTCYDALNGNSKNKRNNISLLLKSNDHYVLIDVGKTFRDSLLHNKDIINFYEIKLDLVLISHSHTDAMNGIDDLRDLQEYNKVANDDIYYYTPKNPIDVYVNEVSYDRLRNGYDYLVKKRTENIFYSKIAALNLFVLKDEKYNKIIEGKNLKEIKDELTDTSEHDTNNMSSGNRVNNVLIEKKENIGDEKKCVNIHTYDKKDEYGFVYTQFDSDKKIRFIPFQHGKNYICTGYIIGENNKLVYISDCSYLPEYVLDYIKKVGPTEVLVIDALYYKAKHYSHFSLYESIQIALIIKPKKVYFIGMSCDIEHNITNLFLKKLSKKYPDISFSLAHDGLFVPFHF
ncbi:conserved Plasmodium protein, unknown function [Plasmodium ovale wallikeri]|uniref:Metallo-beta-lactamase domain-containing protein n=2 Tax=Plasmodium ovale TaxID=36330 RepID=A0A1A9A082_PLAOA|nr:conserved Plasmodium protein, unknown function [Plasmodium ovale wallikeri]SBT58789.1 conserved Plasmodium protein, unknown function [Plasmodium ovale wallikeri]SBT82704.1 conserved Plasmodium protein, unknown function [Plasmodium ovale]